MNNIEAQIIPSIRSDDFDLAIITIVKYGDKLADVR